MHEVTRSNDERQCHATQTIACCIDRIGNIPLGRSKVPFSEPLARARLKREVKVASLVVSPKALFIQTNFLRDWRLLSMIVSKDVPE